MTKEENLKLVEDAMMSIIKMDDILTLDEQFDCVVALRNLRAKLKQRIRKSEETL